MNKLYGGIYLKLKDKRIDVISRLKIAVFAWYCPSAFLPPDKHIVLTEWILGVLFNENITDLNDLLSTWKVLLLFVSKNNRICFRNIGTVLRAGLNCPDLRVFSLASECTIKILRNQPQAINSIALQNILIDLSAKDCANKELSLVVVNAILTAARLSLNCTQDYARFFNASFPLAAKLLPVEDLSDIISSILTTSSSNVYEKFLSNDKEEIICGCFTALLAYAPGLIAVSFKKCCTYVPNRVFEFLQKLTAKITFPSETLADLISVARSSCKFYDERAKNFNEVKKFLKSMFMNELENEPCVKLLSLLIEIEPSFFNLDVAVTLSSRTTDEQFSTMLISFINNSHDDFMSIVDLLLKCGRLLSFIVHETLAEKARHCEINKLCTMWELILHSESLTAPGLLVVLLSNIKINNALLTKDTSRKLLSLIEETNRVVLSALNTHLSKGNDEFDGQEFFVHLIRLQNVICKFPNALGMVDKTFRDSCLSNLKLLLIEQSMDGHKIWKSVARRFGTSQMRIELCTLLIVELETLASINISWKPEKNVLKFIFKHSNVEMLDSCAELMSDTLTDRTSFLITYAAKSADINKDIKLVSFLDVRFLDEFVLHFTNAHFCYGLCDVRTETLLDAFDKGEAVIKPLRNVSLVRNISDMVLSNDSATLLAFLILSSPNLFELYSSLLSLCRYVHPKYCFRIAEIFLSKTHALNDDKLVEAVSICVELTKISSDKTHFIKDVLRKTRCDVRASLYYIAKLTLLQIPLQDKIIEKYFVFAHDIQEIPLQVSIQIALCGNILGIKSESFAHFVADVIAQIKKSNETTPDAVDLLLQYPIRVQTANLKFLTLMCERQLGSIYRNEIETRIYECCSSDMITFETLSFVRAVLRMRSAIHANSAALALQLFSLPVTPFSLPLYDEIINELFNHFPITMELCQSVLLYAVRYAINSTFAQQPTVTIEFAHCLDRLLFLIASKSKSADVSFSYLALEISHKIIRNATLSPEVRTTLKKSVYHLLSKANKKVLNHLMNTSPTSVREYFREMYADFGEKFKFSGKI